LNVGREAFSCGGVVGRSREVSVAGLGDGLTDCRGLASFLHVDTGGLAETAGLTEPAPPLPMAWPDRSGPCKISGATTRGVASIVGRIVVGVEPRAVVGDGLTPVAGRSALPPKCPVPAGWAAVVPPTARGNRPGDTLGASGTRAAPLPPLRSSDLDRAPGPGCVPVGAGNCGRKTDMVRLLPSNRSPRPPCPAGAFTWRMLISWICVPVAAATRPTGIP
jgi:hypothetical protein